MTDPPIDYAEACKEAFERGDRQRAMADMFAAIMEAQELEKNIQEAAERAQLNYREAKKMAKEAMGQCAKAIAIAESAKHDAQAASSQAAEAMDMCGLYIVV